MSWLTESNSRHVQRILVDVNTTGHAFLQWAKGIFLQQNNNSSDKEEDNVRTFPIGFILNTGTHQNGGKHWQSIYFDDEGVSYFFILMDVLRQKFSKDSKSLSEDCIITLIIIIIMCNVPLTNLQWTISNVMDSTKQ